jgi:hypothetical protein
MIQPTRHESKWQRVRGPVPYLLINVLPIVLVLLFVAVLILRSEILRPGGIWVKKPDTGNVITDNRVTLKLSAYSYTMLPLDRVEVRYWFEGINRQVWKMLCTFQPREDKMYVCDFDFLALKAPVGKKILVSFDAYGILMREHTIGNLLSNYHVAPDGWACFYWQQKDVANPCGAGYP